MEKSPTAQLNVRLPQDVLEKLRSHAAQLRQPVSAVVLQAIGECLDGSGQNREAQTEAPSPAATQQPSEPMPKAPPTIPHQPQARQPTRQRPRQRIPIAMVVIILALTGIAGMAYWVASNAGIGTVGWLPSAAILAIVEQADAAQEILAVGSDGLRTCLNAL